MKERKIPRGIKVAGGALLAISLGVTYASSKLTGKPLLLSQIGSDYITSVPQLVGEYINQDDCNITHPTVRTEVRQIFESDRTNPEGIADFHDLVQASAKENGLTLVDERPFVDAIDKAESFEQVLEELNAYSQHHNMTFSIPDAFEKRDFPANYTTLDLKTFDLAKFKSMTTGLLNDLYYVPIEFSGFADRLNIKIVDKIDLELLLALAPDMSIREQLRESKKITEAGAFTNPITKNVYVYPRHLSSRAFSSRILHEKSHAFMFKYCGILGAIEDNEYARLNPSGFRYNDGESYEEFPNITTDKYGYEAVFEDAAYTMGDIILSRKIYNALSNTEREKLLLLLSRIDQVIPGYAKYWKTLPLEYLSPIEEVLLDNTEDTA